MPTPLNIVAIIQARMNASRLPGKVLLDIGGQPMLGWMIERTGRAASLSNIVIATTVDASDDPVAAFCAAQGLTCSRGSQADVLDRYVQAARQVQADVIVRLTADCPLIDPGLIDATVAAFLEGYQSGEQRPPARSAFAWDFAANRLPPPWGRTYPIGLDVEVCSRAALEQTWTEAQQPHQREHVLPFLYERSTVYDARTNPEPPALESLKAGQFRCLLLNHHEDLGSLRWTVDTPQDLEAIRQVAGHFAPRRDFSWLEVLDLYRQQPQLAEINASVVHKSAHDVDERTTPR